MKRFGEFLRLLWSLSTVAGTIGTVSSRTQAQECAGCTLALYADSAMTVQQAVPAGVSQTLYLGVRYMPGAVPELSGVEFSVRGLEPFLVSFTPFDSPPIVLGSPAAPVDTLVGAGGANVAWGRCLTGDRVLAKLVLVPRTVWPQSAVLHVDRRFPPGNPTLRSPLLTRCDDPVFTTATLSGGTFLLGPAGEPVCSVTVADDGPLVAEDQSAPIHFTVTNTGAGILHGVVSETSVDFQFDDAVLGFMLGQGQSRSFALRFWPHVPGPQVCLVNLGTGCVPIEIHGRSPAIVTIADVYTHADSLAGLPVVVEGQVSVPINHELPEPYHSCWLQDESGRGIQLLVDRGSDLLVRSEHQRVHVAASAQLFEGIVRLRLPTVIRLLAAGLPAVDAPQLGLLEATAPERLGTRVQLSGEVTASTPGYRTRYVLTDVTGRVGMSYPQGSGEDPLPTGTGIVARGVITRDSQGPVLYVPFRSEVASGPSPLDCALNIAPMNTAAGESTTVAVSLGRRAAATTSLRMQFLLDPAALQFLDATCVGAAAGWTRTVRPVSPDTVIVEASGNPIGALVSDQVLQLRLGVLGCPHFAGALRVEVLDPGWTGLRICNGIVRCSTCRAGDMNSDHVLTPGDALCVFETFLGAGTVPAGCNAAGACTQDAADADCDGIVTPADALAVLHAWATGVLPPADCIGKAVAGPTAGSGTTAAYRFDPGRSRDAGALVEIPFETCSGLEDAAFGFDFEFDPLQVEFVGLRRTDCAGAWSALGARLLSPGRLRAGGYAWGGSVSQNPAGEWRPCAWFTFRRKAPGEVRGTTRWIVQIPALATTGAAAIELGRPFPNPARAAVSFALSTETPYPRWIRVVDVRGRTVRTLSITDAVRRAGFLRWDGRDATGAPVAAGLYVAEFDGAGGTERRKFVVLH